MQTIKGVDFPHADNKSIIDFFGFYNHSALLDHVDAKQMFSINVRFTLEHDNKVTVYLAWNGVVS